MSRRTGQWVFAVAAGLFVAIASYRWASDPAPRIERARQEAAVMAARERLEETLGIGVVELVDPLAPNRKVGKAFVYPTRDGWEISGFYRRGDGDRWHPYLMTLDTYRAMVHLKIQDDALAGLELTSPEVEVLPDATRTR